MNQRTSPEYSHKLSREAAELLLQFDRRIREFSGVEPSSDAKEYIAYNAPVMQGPFVYSDRRRSKFVVRLNIPFEKLPSEIDPEGLCEKGNAFPTFYEGPRLMSHVMVCCDSSDRIEYIISVIRQVFSLKSKHSRPVDLIERAPSSNRRARISANLNQVHDLVKDVVDEIQQVFQPRLDRSTGELVKTDTDRYAVELLDAVRKLQVVLGEDLHDDDGNEV